MRYTCVSVVLARVVRTAREVVHLIIINKDAKMADDSLPSADEVRARVAQAKANELASARKEIADALRFAATLTRIVHLPELSRETQESLRRWIEERGFCVDFETSGDACGHEYSTTATITVPAATAVAAVATPVPDEKATNEPANGVEVVK